MTGPASPSSHSPFCEEVFSICSHGAVPPCWKRPDTAGRLQPNEVDRTNILAPGFVPAAAGITFFPPSPSRFSRIGPVGSRIQLQQRNCSRFSRDFLRRSTFQARKELLREVMAWAWYCKALFEIHSLAAATIRRPSATIELFPKSVSSSVAKV